MADAPKKIWAWVDALAGVVGQTEKPETPENTWPGPTATTYWAHYVRADIAEAWKQAAKDLEARIEQLEAERDAAYKRGLESAAKAAEGMSFPMQDTANQSAGLPTAGNQVAAQIRFQIQED